VAGWLVGWLVGLMECLKWSGRGRAKKQQQQAIDQKIAGISVGWLVGGWVGVGWRLIEVR
jgi:hypothetical protein